VSKWEDWIIIEKKQRGEVIYDPVRVEKTPINVFANVVSRWDTVGEKF
jgi:hypothetical protein